MNEIRNITTGEVLAPDDLHPVRREGEADRAQIAEKLMAIAEDARKFSYSPYSQYSVGAALLCMDGKIYTGTNVETAAFTGVCAERNAVFKAISEGRTKFAAIAVAGGIHDHKSQFCSPCGVCRQVLSEFVNPDEFIIVFRTEDGEVNSVPFGAMLPFSFGPQNIK